MEALWFTVRDVVTETILELHYCILSTIICSITENISENADLSTGLNYQVGSRQSDLNPEKCQYSILWNRNGGKSYSIHIITISLPHDTFIASVYNFTSSCSAFILQRSFSGQSCVYFAHHCAEYGGVSY